MMTTSRPNSTPVSWVSAIASQQPRVPEGFDWERVKAVEERLARRGIQLLGIQVCDDESWASTGPMYSFESYALDDLPRAIVIPGPHPFASCECVACAPQRQRLRSAPPMAAV